MEKKIFYPKNPRTRPPAEDPEPSKAEGPSIREFAPISSEALESYYENHDLIKIVRAVCPFKANIVLKDAAFSHKVKEDEIYLKDFEALHRLRRGNSLISFKSGEGSKTVVSRRGLCKFFDMRKEHMRVLTGELPQEDLMKGGVKSSFEFRIITAKLIDRLHKGSQVNVYRSGKANGENAQISFVDLEEHGLFWVVCSKNVQLIFNDIKQIDTYVDDRFAYAKLIGKCWHRIVSSMSPEKVESLKKLLLTNTFVGEYCGNPELQHFVVYPQETIIFYAIVEKDCSRPCWPMNESFETFDFYALQKVHLEEVKSIESIKSVGQIINAMDKRLAESTVEEEGEGSVVYFEDINPVTKKFEVLSMCKLKTLEYRFLRKIREKVKKHLNNRGSVGSLQIAFEKETQELLEEYGEVIKMKHDLGYYSELFKLACTAASEKKLDIEYISSQFLDYITLIKKCKEEKRDLTDEEVEQMKASFKGLVAKKKEDPKPTKAGLHIVVVDIPGLIDPTSLAQEIKSKHQLELGFDYTLQTQQGSLQLINLTKSTISLKKLKPNTFILVPGNLEALKEDVLESCSLKVQQLFKGIESDELVAKYLKSSVNAINTPNNIRNMIDLSVTQIKRIFKQDEKLRSFRVSQVIEGGPYTHDLYKQIEMIVSEASLPVDDTLGDTMDGE